MKRYIANVGDKPFDYTLKELYMFNCAEYLCKPVIIEYWKTIDVDEEDCTQMDDYCVFSGEISCIASKGQLRLQYMDILSPKSPQLQHKYLPNPFHHSYWFSFKLIRKVYLIINNDKQQLQDITNKLLNIIKFKIAQSFIFYCGDYSPISQFCKKNIKKFINQNYKYKTDEKDNIDMENLKIFIKHKLSYLASNLSSISESLVSDAQCFFNDLNRSNAHILFGEWCSRNQQRKLMKINIKTLMMIVKNYIILWHNWIKGIEGNSFHKRRKRFIKMKVFECKDEEKEQWADYIDWDRKEVCDNCNEFVNIYVDIETSTDVLYNTTPFDESGCRLSNVRRISGKRRYRPNRYESQRIDQYWKYIHSRPYINNKIYVNTKIVPTFNRHTRRNSKKRLKSKKYNRKITRSHICKQTRDEQVILKRDELLLERMERTSRGYKELISYTKLIQT